jgi:SEC-C motif
MPDSRLTPTKITSAVAELKSLLATKDTLSTVGMCFVKFLHSTRNPTGLLSPGKQIPFLISLQLATSDPRASEQFSNKDWASCVHQLNEIFLLYEEFFWPTSDELPNRDRTTHDKHGVAFKAFLHYFNNPILASAEQMEERVRAYHVPFDAQLYVSLGLTASDSLRISNWITERLQAGLDEFTAATALIGEAQPGKSRPSSLTASQELRAPDGEGLGLRLSKALENLGMIRLNEVRTRFGDAGVAYVQAFSVVRGEGPHLAFPTDSYVLDRRPIVRIDSETGICLAGNALYSALLQTAEDALAASVQRDSFFGHRDAVLESEASLALARILRLRPIQSVYEQPNARFEHDLIAVLGRTVLVAEAKASPPTEPFRDPDRSFTRLQRAFRSDTGIQKAYEQGLRLRRLLLGNDDVTLFDQQGRSVLEIKRPADVFVVCVTRDSFGPLATDLSVLLERPVGEPFPWVASVLDLQQIAEAWEYLDWGASEFVRYLQQRIQLHERVFGSDELEFVGFFIRHGSLTPLFEQGDAYINLEPSYSDWFDELYLYRHGAGPPPAKVPVQPVMRELYSPKPTPSDRPASQGSEVIFRRRPCPCGSGQRYKDCHGRRR